MRIFGRDIEKGGTGGRDRWLYNIIYELLKIREGRERKVNNEDSKKSKINCSRCMNIKQGGWYNNTLTITWRFHLDAVVDNSSLRKPM